MARHPKSIEQFKSRLAFGGVRPTMFQVELTFPTGLALPNQNDLAEDSKFLVKAAQLPASQVGVIDVPFRGRKLKVSGDRSYADWSTTITNDHSFGLRVALEKWSELIQNHNFALGANELSQYFGTAIVRQLDRDANQIRAYKFRGIWPTTVGEIGLDFDSTDQVEFYDCTWAVQYWTAMESGDGIVANNPVNPTTTGGAVTPDTGYNLFFTGGLNTLLFL